MQSVRVLIVDDHEVFRRGVRAVLSETPGIVVVGEAATGDEAVALAHSEDPNVIIMDISLPGMNGLAATRAILSERSSAQILILSAHDSPEISRAVLAAGARGYILKSDLGRDLIAAVHALSLSRIYLTSKVSDVVLENLAKGTEPPSTESLTEREKTLVRLLFEGRSNKEIAEILGISVRTVETHRKNLMMKTKAKSIGEVFRYAIRAGLIQV